MIRSTCSIVAGLVVALFLLPPSALAQITTGTVTGRVVDSSGGVIPGANVILISETRGTKSAPVVTNDTGDYVFPNVTPDTYTVEVTVAAFKTTRRTGIVVTGGDRVGVPPLTLEVGGTVETVTVTAEAALVQTQSGERSFAITTQQIENLPVARGNFTSLMAFTPGVRWRRHLRRRHAAGRRQSEQHHDGRHLGHGHGQQRPDADHEHRVDR